MLVMHGLMKHRHRAAFYGALTQVLLEIQKNQSLKSRKNPKLACTSVSGSVFTALEVTGKSSNNFFVDVYSLKIRSVCF